MALFQIRHDCVEDHVEAENMREAIEKWKKHTADENDGEIFEPESCALIDEKPVIR